MPLWPELWYKNNQNVFIGDLSKPINCHGSWAGNHVSQQSLTRLQGSQDQHRLPWRSPRSPSRARVRPDELWQITLEGKSNTSPLQYFEEKDQASGWEAIYQHTWSKSSLSSFLMHLIWRGSDPKERSSPLKNRTTRNQIIGSNRSAPGSNCPDSGSLSQRLMYCDGLITTTNILRQSDSRTVRAQSPSSSFPFTFSIWWRWEKDTWWPNKTTMEEYRGFLEKNSRVIQPIYRWREKS